MTPVLPPPKSVDLSAKAVIKRRVDYLDLGDDLCVFQIAHSVVLDADAPNSLRERFTPNNQAGIAKLANLRKFLRDKANAVPVVKNLVLVPEGFLECARTQGFSDACQTFSSNASGPNVYEQFAQGKASVERLVLADQSTHMLFDRHGEVLPTAVSFDYMGGSIRNGCYDLDKLIAVLKADARVSPAPADGCGHRPSETPLQLQISQVPYYNSRPSCSSHVAFKFAPTLDDMRRLWAQMKSYGGEYPSAQTHRAIFDLDMLNLRSKGAAKFNGYYDMMPDDDDSTDD